MPKETIGGKYKRQDGTTIASDGIDRRRKLVDDEKNGDFTPKDAGVKREFEGTQLMKFTFKTPTGLRTESGYTSEDARRKLHLAKNAKVVKSEPVGDEERKKR